MQFRRVLIIKPSALGDVVHTLPVLGALKRAHPHSEVSWLISSHLAQIIEGHPLLAEVIVFERERYRRMGMSMAVMLEFCRFLKGLRQRRFSLVLDLQGLFRSGIFALATGAPVRVGFDNAREGAPLFYTHRVAVPSLDIHAVDRYFSIARAIGLPECEKHFGLPVLQSDRDRARWLLESAGLQAGRPYVAICASAGWPSKRWFPERFAGVIEFIHTSLGAEAVLVGSEGDREVTGRIIEELKAPPVDLTGKTSLRELVAIIDGARAMVTNDSGPMHIAAAVECPTVAVFGPTNPQRTGPYGPGHKVIPGRAPSSPCYKRQCIYGGTEEMRCLRNITVQDVTDRLEEIYRPAG